MASKPSTTSGADAHSSSNHLSGRSAIVTGSTSGIGLGVAWALARQGCNILLNGFGDRAAIEDLTRQIENDTRVRVLYSAADMSRPSDIREMVAIAEKEFGGVDILVNNAGIQHVAPVDEFPDEKFDAITAINFASNFHAIKAAVPGMKARGWGRIINIASVHGIVASPFKSAYVAAKHAVIGLTKTVALELAETSITCNAICPGYVRTPLVDNQVDQQAKVHNISREAVIRDVILASQPSKRFVETDQVAAFAAFLCSPAASGMTGSVVTMDGGWTAR